MKSRILASLLIALFTFQSVPVIALADEAPTGTDTMQNSSQQSTVTSTQPTTLATTTSESAKFPSGGGVDSPKGEDGVVTATSTATSTVQKDPELQNASSAATSTLATTTATSTNETATTTEEVATTTDEEPDDYQALDLGNNQSDLDAKKDMTGVVRQSKDYYCGPASLATLMTQLGDDTSESQVVEQIATSSLSVDQGTNLLALKVAAQNLTQTHVYLKHWDASTTLAYIAATGDPVLIHDEKKDVGGHFSVIKSYDAEKGTVEISDTEAGNIKYSVEDFTHIFTGQVLVISDATDNELLNDASTNITDEDAAQVWGKYVPVYLAAQNATQSSLVAVAAFKSCIASAMTIANYAQRNNARQICYTALGKALGPVLNDAQELSVIRQVELDQSLNDTNKSAVGTVDILSALDAISAAQDDYAKQTTAYTQQLVLGGGSLGNLASYQSKLSQAQSDKSLLDPQIASKQSSVNSLQAEINAGSFVQNNTTFSLGAVNSQITAQVSSLNNISTSLSAKLSSLDGQISQAQNAKNSAQSNYNSYTSNANSYQSSANSAYSNYQYYSRLGWKYSATASYYYSLYTYYNSLASLARQMASYYQGQMSSYANQVSSLQSQKTQAQTTATSQMTSGLAEYARLQRIQQFGQQEMQRKQGLLATMKAELANLQSQQQARVTIINTYQPKVTALQAAQAAQTAIAKDKNTIDTLKARWGFANLGYDQNPTEITRLRNEELANEKKWDTSAEQTATTDVRNVPFTTATGALSYASTHPGDIVFYGGVGLVGIGGTLLCIATGPACATALSIASLGAGSVAVYNGYTVVTTQKDVFGSPVTDAEWGNVAMMLPVDLVTAVGGAAGVKAALSTKYGAEAANNLAMIAVKGGTAERSAALGEVTVTLRAARVTKMLSSAEKNLYAGKFFATDAKLQSVYTQHPEVFGFTGVNWSPANGQAFKQAIVTFLNKSDTEAVVGTYRGVEPSVHFFNRTTRQWVATTPEGELKTGWVLTNDQFANLIRSGNVQ